MRIFKKTVSLMLVLLMVHSLAVSAETVAPTDTSFRVFFNGQEINFPDEKPFFGQETIMPDGSVYKATDMRIKFVPIRALGEALGYEVSWDSEINTAIIKKGDKTVKFVLGDQCYVNDKTKSCVVNFPLKNGRVSVSQFGICHAFDCTMSWNDENRILNLFSKEKFPKEAVLTQERYIKEDVVYDKLSEFYSMAEPAFTIPGLQQGIVPQSIAYRKDTNEFYLGGYFLFGTSKLSVVDAESGKLKAQYPVLQENGKNHTGHFGGIAVSDKHLYIQDGSKLQRISLETVDTTQSGDYLQVEENINISMGYQAGNSFIEISDGYLWTGNFYQSNKKKYAGYAAENYPVLIRGYRLDSSQPDGFAAEFKAEHEKYDYIPEILYTLENNEQIQGMTKMGNYIITSAGNDTKSAFIRVYDITKAAEESDFVTMEEKQIPVKLLKLEKSVVTFSCIEELAEANGSFYFSFESGTQVYGGGNYDCITDQVWKVDPEKLVAPSSK